MTAEELANLHPILQDVQAPYLLDAGEIRLHRRGG